jgi:hypothetical protein
LIDNSFTVHAEFYGISRTDQNTFSAFNAGRIVYMILGIVYLAAGKKEKYRQ